MFLPALTLALAIPVSVLRPAADTIPGYWQQHLDYDINAILDEARGLLHGSQRVRYRNNSPDSLNTVSFHLYLNAFRPGSRWADADSMEGRRRFNDLAEPDYAYNRIANVRIMEQPAVPIYPFAPDSTVVRFTLPRPVGPGEEFTVTLDWEARPSTVPRRQGRRGRHYDFAQWYPRVVAYDKYGWQEHPLYPAGEFYGDFGDFRVSLDLPADQVVGATGVPVCGDPGWERANRVPGRPVEYEREHYGSFSCEETAPPGRKRVTWVAREVHHFALSMNPEYRYEGGRYGPVLVHVLYQPGDERSWGGGVAVRNTVAALAWLDRLFGSFPWPQLTNLHRIEGGGTEFPMMIMDGSAGIGLIVHETGHNYLMGILANNEWKEGWLDEGFTSFQTSWFTERATGRSNYATLEQNILFWDLEGWTQSLTRPAEAFRDFATYNAMVYNRGELFFHQLRGILGDSTMARVLRAYYDRWKLKHVDEAAFREVAEAVSGRDLRTLFGQWIHSPVLYDYGVRRVRVQRADSAGVAGYATRVELRRRSPGVYPVTVAVRSRTDSARTVASGWAEREWVELWTRERPREVEVDPEGRSHDWNRLNNRQKRGLFGFRSSPRTSVYLDRFFSQPVRRDGLTLGLAPTLWYNDEGGLTVGIRERTDYLGRFVQNRGILTLETRRLADGEPRPWGAFLRWRNPLGLYRPRTTQELEAFRMEGRTGLAASVERDQSRRRTGGTRITSGLGARWLATSDTGYLDPAFWDNGGTLEASVWTRFTGTRGAWNLGGRVTVGGGIEYRSPGPGLNTEDRYDVQPTARVVAELAARRPVARRIELALRAYAGAVFSESPPLKQRQLFAAGADPYRQFSNPFVRSRGALLVRDGVHYLVPGGGGVRGVAPALSGTRMAALNLDLSRVIIDRPAARLFREIRVALFGDLAVGNGELATGTASAGAIGDAGIGIRAGHRIGDTFFTTRIDFPLYLSRSELANRETGRAFGLRWVWTVEDPNR